MMNMSYFSFIFLLWRAVVNGFVQYRPKLPSSVCRNANPQSFAERLEHPDGHLKSSREKLPSTKDLLTFGLPTLGMWLTQPILSLIDTSTIGLSSNVHDIAQIAALGPSVAWVDGTAYLCSFVGIATTNMYTLALDQKNDDKAKEVLSHSFVISLGLGLFTMMVQILGSKAVISNLAGSSTSIIPYAMKYARIRSLGSIVGIPTMFGQAAFLARRDPITPLKAVLLGSFLNFIGDILLVIGFGYGIEGAAIATVISQFGCALYLLYGIMSSQSSKETSSSSTIQQKLYNLSHRITFPSWKQLKSYLLFCYPIFFVLFAKSFLFSYSTYACSNAGEASIASHQISINLFCFFGYFGEAVSQMSQTFLPGLLKNRGKSEFNGEKSNPTLENIESMQGKNETDALEVEKKTVKYQTKLRNRFQSKAYILFGRICKLGLGLGFLSGVFAYYFQRFGHRIFTASVGIAEQMKLTAPLLALCVLPFPLMAGCEGAILAAQDATFNALFFVSSGMIYLTYMEWVRRGTTGLVGVWCGLATFQWVRLLVFSCRMYSILRRTFHNHGQSSTQTATA